MAAVEQTYAYLAPSTVAVDSDGTEVTLSTSGGGSPHPYFFTGFLGEPRQTAQALLAVAEVARTRYYVPPGSASRLAAADPVVTSNVDRLRFESFSGCAGVYARLDLEPELLGGEAAAWGTTNVDFNLPMRAALARVHDADAMLMHVGHDEVRVTTLAGSEVERKVPLPERWVKGFAEVQVSASQMLLRHELGRGGGASVPPELCRGPARAESPGRRLPGGTLRLTTQPDDGAVCIAGPERLRLLEKLLPVRAVAAGLRAAADLAARRRAERLGARPERRPRRVRAQPGALPRVLRRGRRPLRHWPPPTTQPSKRSPSCSTASRRSTPARSRRRRASTGRRSRPRSARSARRAVSAMTCRQGRSSIESFRTTARSSTRCIRVCSGRVSSSTRVPCGSTAKAATVASGDVEYVVRFDDDGARCTCAWFARHRGERGPCKHVLAAEQVRRSARVT